MAKEEPNKSQAIRDAIEKLGIDAKGPEIKAAVIKAHPSLSEWCASAGFGSQVSSLKKKARGDGGSSTGSTTTSTQPKKASAPTSLASVSEMLTSLKSLVAAHGKEEVKKLVDLLEGRP